MSAQNVSAWGGGGKAALHPRDPSAALVHLYSDDEPVALRPARGAHPLRVPMVGLAAVLELQLDELQVVPGGFDLLLAHVILCPSQRVFQRQGGGEAVGVVGEGGCCENEREQEGKAMFHAGSDAERREGLLRAAIG